MLGGAIHRMGLAGLAHRPGRPWEQNSILSAVFASPTALDILGESGEPIYAAESGIVVWAGSSPKAPAIRSSLPTAIRGKPITIIY